MAEEKKVWRDAKPYVKGCDIFYQDKVLPQIKVLCRQNDFEFEVITNQGGYMTAAIPQGKEIIYGVIIPVEAGDLIIYQFVPHQPEKQPR